MPEFIVPPTLRPGDFVRVIAPSGAFDRTLFWRGLGWLAQHFRPLYTRRLFEREGFCAGSRAARLQELNTALHCPLSRAIIAARGGFGAGELAPHAAFCQLRVNPKWLVGFSDITALHVECQRLGVASLHAHNLTGLGRADAAERQVWLHALLGQPAPAAIAVERLLPGDAAGPLIGGNLTLVHQCVTTGRWRPPAGCVLFIEEVNEAPYRVARLLLALEQAGALDRVSALVVGDVSPAPGARKQDTLNVFLELGRRCRLPVVCGLQAGHERVNRPLVLGQTVDLRGSELHFSAPS